MGIKLQGRAFEGRVALVTGAGKGLGKAYALWLAAHGATVLVNNRRRGDEAWSAEQVVAQIRAGGGEAIPVAGSVEVQPEAEAMVKAALDAYGRLDILVCNAGISPGATFHKVDLDQFRHVVDVNFYGCVYPLHAALPAMREAKYGRVVLATSAAAYCGSWGLSAYGSAKAAVIGLARSVAVENAERNIRVNVISPFAYTPMTEPYIPEKKRAIMDVEHVAPVVGWLAHEDCPANGAVIEAGAGMIRRTVFGVGKGMPLGENLAAQWPALQDFSGTVELWGAIEATKTLMKA